MTEKLATGGVTVEKLQQFSLIAVEITTAIFPVKCQYNRIFSGRKTRYYSS